MPIQIEGTTLRLRGRELVLPPLDVRTVRKFTRNGKLQQVIEIERSKGLPTDDQWGALIDLLTDAFKANYPDITPDEVEGLIDFATLPQVLEAMFASSGFKRLPPGEGQSPSTGTAS